jgi:hypothetical protein
MSFFSAIPINQEAGFNAPVNTPLTREEIARSTFTYGFIPENENADTSGNVCPISLEQFQEGDVICEIRGCRHKFKRPLLMNWFRQNSRCPVCRYELRNYVDTSSAVPQTTNRTTTEPGDDTPIVASVSQDQQLSDAIANIMQSFLQNPNSTLDSSGNLLYEFQYPMR